MRTCHKFIFFESELVTCIFLTMTSHGVSDHWRWSRGVRTNVHLYFFSHDWS